MFFNEKEESYNNQNTNLEGCLITVPECPKETVCKRDIHYTVEHIAPIHTKIINNHIYHHVYKPVYTCSVENICTNVCDCPCSSTF